MKKFNFQFFLIFLAALFCLLPQPLSAQPDAGAPQIAFEDVRVFDGESMHQNWTVLVADGRIQDAGADITIPENFKRIDGSGKTLLPGLIDSHVHAFGGALEQALNFGVTTVLDMFTSPMLLDPAHQRRRTLAPQTRADMFSAGVLATAPGGHGTEYGMDIPTVSQPEEAESFVETRIEEGSDYIKIVYNEKQGRFPSINEATLKALIEAAHDHGLMGVVHISNRASAQTAIEAGSDGLVHIFGDEVAGEDFIEAIRQSGAFVIPTLSVLESAAGTGGAENLLDDESLAPYLTPSIKAQLKAKLGKVAGKELIETARTNVRLLHQAGVPMLAGTDAPNAGTAHGVSLHRELVLLTQSGLSNLEALAAATTVPAAVFGLENRGRIAPGMIADLILVRGNPAEAITATRDIVTIWKDGYPVERKTAADLKKNIPEAPEDSAISNFDEAISTTFGHAWQVTTDAMRGGHSVAQMERVSPGASGSAGALTISGEIKPGFPFPWAGVIFYPTETPMQPMDFSTKSNLVFWTKGDGGTYRVLLFSGGNMTPPASVSFKTVDDWQRVVVPFSDFAGIDLSTLRGLSFSAGPESGKFRFIIDEVMIN